MSDDGLSEVNSKAPPIGNVMDLLKKRKIIVSVTFVLIMIFLGLKTETRTEISVPMAWDVHTLYFYGFPIMSGGGLLAPFLEMATIGHFKYLFCGAMVLIGGGLFMAVKVRSLAKLLNILSWTSLIIAIVFVFSASVAKVYEDGWNSMVVDVVVFGGYITIVIVFMPAMILKALSGYCRDKKV